MKVQEKGKEIFKPLNICHVVSQYSVSKQVKPKAREMLYSMLSSKKLRSNLTSSKSTMWVRV